MKRKRQWKKQSSALRRCLPPCKITCVSGSQTHDTFLFSKQNSIAGTAVMAMGWFENTLIFLIFITFFFSHDITDRKYTTIFF